MRLSKQINLKLFPRSFAGECTKIKNLHQHHQKIGHLSNSTPTSTSTCTAPVLLAATQVWNYAWLPRKTQHHGKCGRRIPVQKPRATTLLPKEVCSMAGPISLFWASSAESQRVWTQNPRAASPARINLPCAKFLLSCRARQAGLLLLLRMCIWLVSFFPKMKLPVLVARGHSAQRAGWRR